MYLSVLILVGLCIVDAEEITHQTPEKSGYPSSVVPTVLQKSVRKRTAPIASSSDSESDDGECSAAQLASLADRQRRNHQVGQNLASCSSESSPVSSDIGSLVAVVTKEVIKQLGPQPNIATSAIMNDNVLNNPDEPLKMAIQNTMAGISGTQAEQALLPFFSSTALIDFAVADKVRNDVLAGKFIDLGLLIAKVRSHNDEFNITFPANTTSTTNPQLNLAPKLKPAPLSNID